jgi:hypothetical protein
MIIQRNSNVRDKRKRCDVLPPYDTIIDIIIDFFIFIKQKIAKPCKRVGVWFCIFFKKKKKSIIVSIIMNKSKFTLSVHQMSIKKWGGFENHNLINHTSNGDF